MGTKTAEFDAEFESVKNRKKVQRNLELLYTVVLKGEKVHNSYTFNVNYFFCRNFCTNFSTDSK